MFPYKLCQIKCITYPPGRKVTPGGYFKSLRHSSFIISTVCKGVVFCPEARSENTLISKLKKLATLMYEPDKNHPSGGDQAHEKILKEQQKELERLKTDPKLKRDADEDKFPKYTPK